jgi:hypothetical protein
MVSVPIIEADDARGRRRQLARIAAASRIDGGIVRRGRASSAGRLSDRGFDFGATERYTAAHPRSPWSSKSCAMRPRRPLPLQGGGDDRRRSGGRGGSATTGGVGVTSAFRRPDSTICGTSLTTRRFCGQVLAGLEAVSDAASPCGSHVIHPLLLLPLRRLLEPADLPPR